MRRMTHTYMKRKLTGMAASSLRRLALAGMVVLLVEAAPLAQTPEPAQDDSIEALRTRANAGDAEAQSDLGLMYDTGRGVPQDNLATTHADASIREKSAETPSPRVSPRSNAPKARSAPAGVAPVPVTA